MTTANPQIQTKRLTHIDLIKTIAMFFVISYHTNNYSYDFVEQSSAITYLSYLFRTILSTCVPIFFFANGYLLFNKDFVLKKHIIKTVRFAVLTVLWGVINLVCLMIIKNQYFSPVQFVRAIINWEQDWINFLWYMGALVCIYIFFPLFKCAFDHNKSILIFFVSVCGLMTMGNLLLNEMGTVIINLFSQESIILESKNFFNIFNPFRWAFSYAFVYFCAGGLIKSAEERILKCNLFKRNCISVVGLVLSCVCLWSIGVRFTYISGELWDVVWNGYDTIFSFGNVIFIFILSLSYKRDIRLIRLISQNTLGIYFIHWIFIGMALPAFKQVPAFCNIPGNLAFSFVILIVGLVFVLILKKIPLLNKLV